MKIEYRKGNLFHGDGNFIIHCCNAQNKMGKGFAKELRNRFPDCYEKYSETSGLHVGDIIPYVSEGGLTIFNMIGQDRYGNDGKRYVSYDALATCFETLDSIAVDIGMKSLHMPKIGTGLAGGKWQIISSIIETHSDNFIPVVYEI